jgi:hypothetical protein
LFLIYLFLFWEIGNFILFNFLCLFPKIKLF